MTASPDSASYLSTEPPSERVFRRNRPADFHPLYKALPLPLDPLVLHGERSIAESLRLADQEGRVWRRTGKRGDAGEADRCRSLLSTPIDEALGTATQHVIDRNIDALCSKVLVLPCSKRWREAVSTALLGPWPCVKRPGIGQFGPSLELLRAEARTIHQQLGPLWGHRKQRRRVLLLDADFNGLSLHDLIASRPDDLSSIESEDWENEILNRVLRQLRPEERRTALALAAGEGTTWAEAAAAAGAADPEALGERVRRKAKRLAAEQRRRAAQRYEEPARKER